MKPDVFNVLNLNFTSCPYSGHCVVEGVYKWWQGSIQLGKGTHVAYMLGRAIWEEEKTLVTGPWLLGHFCLAIGLYLVILVTQWKSNKSLTTSYRLSIGEYSRARKIC